MARWLLPVLVASLSLSGCGDDGSGTGDDGGSAADGGPTGRDGGSPRDGGGTADDAGTTDAGTTADAGTATVDAGPATGCEPAPTERSGEGTYYDADGSGNCSFPPSPGDLMVAAMNETDYMGSAPCGACAHVVGPSGEVTVRIVDRCPECAPGDIDMSPQAFERVAALSAGRVDITWRYVPCEVTGPVAYHFKEGSNPWWTAVQVRNHRHAVARFEYLGDDGAYHEVPRLEYNYFVEAGGMGDGPYAFRITDVYGHVLEDSGIAFVEGGEVSGAGQFPPCD